MTPEFSQLQDVPFGLLNKRLGEIWQALPDDQKSPYRQKAATEAARYREQMAGSAA